MSECDWRGCQEKYQKYKEYIEKFERLQKEIYLWTGRDSPFICERITSARKGDWNNTLFKAYADLENEIHAFCFKISTEHDKNLEYLMLPFTENNLFPFTRIRQ